MGVIAYNFLHMLRSFYVIGEGVKRSIEWLIKRLIKVGAKVIYHSRRWHVHVASAFPLVRHYEVYIVRKSGKERGCLTRHGFGFRFGSDSQISDSSFGDR